MRGLVPPDPETSVSELHYAVVQTGRRPRTRFPAGCVQIVASRAAALAQAEPARNRHAATVIGPSKSSEGQFIYYLSEWLE